MNFAIQILEGKVKSITEARDGFRRSAMRKDKGLNEFFIRWGKESTQQLRSLRKAIKQLKTNG